MRGRLFYIQCEPYVAFTHDGKAYTRKAQDLNKKSNTAIITFKKNKKIVNLYWLFKWYIL